MRLGAEAEEHALQQQMAALQNSYPGPPVPCFVTQPVNLQRSRVVELLGVFIVGT